MRSSLAFCRYSFSKQLIPALVTGLGLAQLSAMPVEVILTPDALNSSVAAFGSSINNLTNDPFVYNIADPTATLPIQLYAAASFFHANEPDGTTAFLNFTFPEQVIPGDGKLVIDLYTRTGCPSCEPRDDEFDVEFYSGGLNGTLVSTVSGLGFENSPDITDEGHIRVTLEGPATVETVRIVAPDSDGGNHGTASPANYFTLAEIRAAYLPPVIDNDNDGLDDAWEIANNLSPSDDGTTDPDNGPDGDPDEDLLSNLEEFEARTDPRDSDSDDDLLPDGAEVNGAGSRPATDPNLADTDGDTLSDFVETNTGIFIGADDTGSNPTIIDTDSDGSPDGDEVRRSTNPSDPNSGANLALGKSGGYFDNTGAPAAAWGALPASNVTDGNPATISHTLAQVSTDYYYELDLGEDFSISSIALTGRGFRDTCCPERLENQTLVILNSSGTEVYRQVLVDQIIMTEEFDLTGAAPFGQFVRIVNTSSAPYGPQLGEVEIYGSSTPPAAPLITSFKADPTTGAITLNWVSQPGATYSIFGSSNLIDYSEINDSVPSNGTESTFNFNDPEIIGKSRYFYRITQN